MRTDADGGARRHRHHADRPGEFTHPAPGLTVFAQSMDENGEIKNLFIDKASPNGGSTTYMAAEGRIAKRNGAPVLVLHDGSIQQFSKTGVLNVLSFDENVLRSEAVPGDRGPGAATTPPTATCTSCSSRTCARPGSGPTCKKLISEGNAGWPRRSTTSPSWRWRWRRCSAAPFSRLGYARPHRRRRRGRRRRAGARASSPARPPTASVGAQRAAVRLRRWSASWSAC